MMEENKQWCSDGAMLSYNAEKFTILIIRKQEKRNTDED
jgi:hypothetical protein